ncbi:MAG: hypothetical protein QNJ75_09780 [Acidimicrobiia bacterium]|nr:hypothetical protein [Acidimicrobiia bacterium]
MEWMIGAAASLTCALLFLGQLTKRRRRDDPASLTDPNNSEKMAAEDLSSMTPPGWDAIPPTISMAAQPDAYFRNRRDSN